MYIYHISLLLKMYKRLLIHCYTLNKSIIKIMCQYTRNLHQNIKKDLIMDTKSIPQIKQELKKRNVGVIEGHTCFIADCFICNINKRKGYKFYINKTTGFFVCSCSRMGCWNLLLQQCSDEKSLNNFENKIEKINDFMQVDNIIVEWNEKKKHCKNIAKLSSDLYEPIIKKLNLFNINQKELSQLNCFYEETSSTLYFPLTAFNKHFVGYKTISLLTLEEQTIPASNSTGLIIYKHKNIKSDSSAILVSRIHDFLILISQQSINTIICLPYHKPNLPQQLLPSLESFNKLILWFGNDEPSWDMARHFAEKLNEKRCYFIRPTANQPRPSIAVDKGYDLNNIIKNAQPVYHKFITTFHYLRQDVLSELQNYERVQGIKWQRYPTLNRILKGHRKGEFTVLTGPTGCGKTTFISEYSLDLAMQGVNTLWGSFEIRNVRLAKTMLQQMAERNLNENVEDFNMFADAFEKLPIYFMTFHGQQSIKVVMDAVEHATYVHDISHVIIDNIQFMMGILDEPKHTDRFWKQDNIISAFRTFATKYNCHVTLVIHPRKEKDEIELTTSSIFGSAKATQEADNVLIIQDKRLSSIRGKKYLQVAKNRYSGDLGIMTLEFDKESLSYSEKKRIKSDKPQESTKKEIVNTKPK